VPDLHAEHRTLAQLPVVFQALAHELRLRALLAFVDGPKSPVQLLRECRSQDANLRSIAYHVQILRRAELVKVSSHRRRRGAVETSFELTDLGFLAVHAIHALKPTAPTGRDQQG
jgi:Helix-turn-helix domain